VFRRTIQISQSKTFHHHIQILRTPPMTNLPILQFLVQHRFRKSDLKLLEINRAVSAFAGNSSGREGDEILDLREDIARSVHIHAVSY
jgi:hypothetical protein